MSQLKVDTYKLENYADRLSSANRRLNQLDRRLDALYWRVGLLDLWNLIQADLLTGYSWRLKRCQGYLQDTARDFEKLERKLASMDPAKFKAPKGSLQYFCVFRQKGSWNDNFKSPKFSRAVMETLWISCDIITSEFKDPTKKQGHIRPRPLTEWKERIEVIFDELEDSRVHTGQHLDVEASFWDKFKEEIARTPENAKSAGEYLGQLEKWYDKLPDWITHCIDLSTPSSLQEAYTLTSGILQGDLTLKEGWDVASSILSSNKKVVIVCELVDYIVDRGQSRGEKGNKEFNEELNEGDILGAVFEGIAGGLDVAVGGTIEVLGNTAGALLDFTIDEAPIIKGINKLTEYGTGLLGWNGGDGYSIGGLIGAGTEAISDGLDVATDYITDATDVVTDAVTDGVKSGIRWVKSWFD